MKHFQLLQAIRAACEVAEDPEIWVFGSQAILGNFPQAEHIDLLSLSIEVDMTPKNKIERVDDIDALLGEGSQFHALHGFYIHGVPIHEAAILPDGWEERCVTIQVKGIDGSLKTAKCIEVNDLIASKLVRFEEKDTEFTRAALRYGMAEADRIISRIGKLKISNRHSQKIRTWINALKKELPKRGSAEKVGLSYGETYKGEGYLARYPSEPKD